MFFVQTPALFVEFLQTVGSGDKAKLDAFFAAHPESTRQAGWLNSHPIPASYAGVDYWGVHAFTFTNAKGETALVKYKAIPDAGELGLTDDEAKAKGDNFYENEMKDRLAKGPVSFELVAIRGKDGDPTNDPTLRWDDEDTPRDDLRSARSASMRSRLQPPAMRSPSCRGTWSTASPDLRTTPCSWRGRPPTCCPSSSGTSRASERGASGGFGIDAPVNASLVAKGVKLFLCRQAVDPRRRFRVTGLELEFECD